MSCHSDDCLCLVTTMAVYHSQPRNIHSCSRSAHRNLECRETESSWSRWETADHVWDGEAYHYFSTKGIFWVVLLIIWSSNVVANQHQSRSHRTPSLWDTYVSEWLWCGRSLFWNGIVVWLISRLRKARIVKFAVGWGYLCI